MKLTDKIVAALPAPTQGNQRTPDSEVAGLAVQVSAAGHKAFVLRYRVGGKERQATIGAFPTWQIAAARHRAKELRRIVDQGIDPLAQEAAARTEGMSLVEFWRRVYEPLHVVTKRPKWARDIRSMMANDILPRLGDRPVKEIDRADMEALHREISRRAPTRANRMRDALRHAMNYAERPHILPDGERIPALRPGFSNPCRGTVRNPEEPRQRYLTPNEMGALAAVLARHPERTSVALTRFLLLTGARFSEAATATWDQFDLDRGIWAKPATATKQQRAHIVPLAAPALMLLQELHAQSCSKFLFPNSADRPLGSIKVFWRSVTRQAGIKGARVHDLRHSFASVLASGGASLHLIGQLLGHRKVGTTARYAHLVDTIQREAVERAAVVITGQPTAEIVPLHRRR
jgi:integrase